MSDETTNDDILTTDEGQDLQETAGLPAEEAHSDYTPVDRYDARAVHHLSGMYQSWFLDYASYVILERAVPHLDDGLKPVQRRILHAMKRMDDGRYNKVANIVGDTMKYHPHGDASIGDALVQMGQKDLVVDTQGNWGNILTGDRAAAPRYIEARLSKFALDALFNAKTTDWQLSYDGRNREPITLPVKFPLLLASGAEGIAVGLSSKILPHNFCEICDAAVSYLHHEPFKLLPDFPTGGSIDAARYNDGTRGGTLKVRAKIDKLDSKTLVIREIPYGKTTASLIDSILKAVEKGKIKVRRVEDNTAAEVEIVVHLLPGVSSDKTLDALYAFSDCEVSISPNCCVIEDKKPRFLSVSDVLRHATDRTKDLIRRELEIRRGELLEELQFASLEKLFIEERVYKDRAFEQAPDNDAALDHIDSRLKPYYPQLWREVTRDDLQRLLEIKMQRILRFNKDKAEDLMARLRSDIEAVERDLADLTEVTARWFTYLRQKYGPAFPRRTEIRSFDTIEATAVVEANEKLYINRQEGFVGTALKKDEFVAACSDLDDIIVIWRDGKMKIMRVADKIFTGKGVLHVGVFKRQDNRTIYNLVYRDGKSGPYYMKRFPVTSVTRDRQYDLTAGTPLSRIEYFTANANGEAEVIKVTLEQDALMKRQSLFMERDFAAVAIRSRSARGSLLTRKAVRHVTLKTKGHSTLGGRRVWYDPDVNRINYDDHGRLLGEFVDQDQILVILPNGDYYTTGFDANLHFEADIVRIEKYDPAKIWTALLLDADNNRYLYLKRFTLDARRSRQNYIGDNAASRCLLLTDAESPLVAVTFGGLDSHRPTLTVDAAQFVGVKGVKAKGRRVTQWAVESVVELPSEPAAEPDAAETPAFNPDTASEPVDSTTPEAPAPEPATLANLFDDDPA